MIVKGKGFVDDRADWDDVLLRYRDQLRFYLDYLVPCGCSDQILMHVEADARERSVPTEFKFRFVMRTMVRNVIAHLSECPESRQDEHHSGQDGGASRGVVPEQERLVYFMRDILEYRPRDASLLMGLSDSQVEQLLARARKRIDMLEGPSSMQIQTPEGCYFRWRIAGL
jgi:hypothetical protein